MAGGIVGVFGPIRDPEERIDLLDQTTPPVVDILGGAAAVTDPGQSPDPDVAVGGIVVVIADIQAVVGIIDNGEPVERIVIILHHHTAGIDLLNAITGCIVQDAGRAGIGTLERVLIAQGIVAVDRAQTFGVGHLGQLIQTVVGVDGRLGRTVHGINDAQQPVQGVIAVGRAARQGGADAFRAANEVALGIIVQASVLAVVAENILQAA